MCDSSCSRWSSRGRGSAGSRCCGDGHRRRSGSGDRRCYRTVESEETHDVVGLFWDSMSNPLGKDGLEVRTISAAGVAIKGTIGLRQSRRLGDTKDVGPLLDLNTIAVSERHR